MPKVNWGVNPRDIDDWDRNSQYKPYDGPVPPNAVYQWKIKVLKYVAGTREKHPQLRIGLELIPRESRKDERKYAGYFIMLFRSITARTEPFYVPFLDAIGVSGREFAERTLTDEEGNITRIGKWRNTGDELIMGLLRDDTDQRGAPKKDMGWMGPLAEDDEYGDDEQDEEIDEEDYDGDEEDYADDEAF